MFLRLLWESFARQRRRKILAGLAILLGVTAVTAMLGLATTIGDRIHQELAVYGANIVVYPKADTLDVKVGEQSLKPATGNAYLHEKDLEKLRGIFWANNITGVSPELRASLLFARGLDQRTISVDTVGLWFQHPFGSGITGAPQLHPSWHLQGAWPTPHPQVKDGQYAVVLGSTVAKRLGAAIGDDILLGDSHVTFDSTSPTPAIAADHAKVVGILNTGAAEDNEALLTLADMQDLAELPDAVSRVEVSAKTRPEDAFARRDPDALSPKDRDVWYCRPYANSIAYQIREAIPGAAAEQVRQVEQSEGTILERISGLMWLISAAALLAAAVAVSAAMATAVLERRAEIGLMRSLGASKGRIASLFYAEAGLLAMIAGVGGYVLGSVIAAALTASIFGQAAGVALSTTMLHAFNPVLLPVVLALALIVAVAGSTASIRSALRMDPSAVLRTGA